MPTGSVAQPPAGFLIPPLAASPQSKHLMSTRIVSRAGPGSCARSRSSPRSAAGSRRARSVEPRRQVAITAAVGGPAEQQVGGFTLPSWLRSAPRIKVRNLEDRGKQQLAELAVLNARLDGAAHWEARQKLEYLQKSRETWEAVYQDLLSSGGMATLESIEETKRKVRLAKPSVVCLFR